MSTENRRKALNNLRRGPANPWWSGYVHGDPLDCPNAEKVWIVAGTEHDGLVSRPPVECLLCGTTPQRVYDAGVFPPGAVKR